MLAQEELERVQLLRDALDVVQAVDADDDLDALEPALERFDAILHALLLQVLETKSVTFPDDASRVEANLGESARVNADREGANMCQPALELGRSSALLTHQAINSLTSTPLGMVGRPSMRVQDERKCRA